MIARQDTPYRFRAYDPTLFVEVYLPKRARYQGSLYETLTDGFDFAQVRAHFADRSRQPRIARLLDDYSEARDLSLMQTMEQFYWGYSLYEVDGMFFSRGQVLSEERTQIIRLMFLPDLERAATLIAPDIKAAQLRRLVTTILHHPSPIDLDFAKAQNPALARYVADWIGAVGLFIFGYLIYNLCERIVALGDSSDCGLEEEIWVTSLWNLRVNRVVLSRPVAME